MAQIVTWYVDICDLYWCQDTDHITMDGGTFVILKNAKFQLGIYENKN